MKNMFNISIIIVIYVISKSSLILANSTIPPRYRNKKNHFSTADLKKTDRKKTEQQAKILKDVEKKIRIIAKKNKVWIKKVGMLAGSKNNCSFQHFFIYLDEKDNAKINLEIFFKSLTNIFNKDRSSNSFQVIKRNQCLFRYGKRKVLRPKNRLKK